MSSSKKELEYLPSSILNILIFASQQWDNLMCRSSAKRDKLVFEANDGKHSHFSLDISLNDYSQKYIDEKLVKLVGKVEYKKILNL